MCVDIRYLNLLLYHQFITLSACVNLLIFAYLTNLLADILSSFTAAPDLELGVRHKRRTLRVLSNYCPGGRGGLSEQKVPGTNPNGSLARLAGFLYDLPEGACGSGPKVFRANPGSFPDVLR